MKTEYNNLLRQISALERELEKMPEGTLEWRRRDSHYRYYHRKDGEKKYLAKKKDKDLIEALAKKKYQQKMLQDKKLEVKAIEKYLKAHNEIDHAFEMLQEQSHLEEILSPHFCPLDAKLAAWAKEDYPSSAGHPESLIHPGPFGKMYRSKSESMIAHTLFVKSLSFRYEWDRMINGIIYPIDFTIRHPKNGKMIFWEHCGIMDQDVYAANIGNKIKAFESVGIFPDYNLILTFESKRFPFHIGLAEEIVDKWFLS